jgi:hypothetical protein
MKNTLAKIILLSLTAKGVTYYLHYFNTNMYLFFSFVTGIIRNCK